MSLINKSYHKSERKEYHSLYYRSALELLEFGHFSNEFGWSLT